MNDVITYLISGLAIGCAFALVGSGFVVVHRVTRVVNFTQGTLAVFGAMFAYSLLSRGLPHGLAETLAVLGSGAIGLLFGVIALSRRGTSPLISLMITLGLSIFSSAVIILIWGQDPLSPPGLSGTVSIAGASIETQRVLVASSRVFGCSSTTAMQGRASRRQPRIRERHAWWASTYDAWDSWPLPSPDCWAG
jgi:branched-chain amino acid transport system permease protein